MTPEQRALKKAREYKEFYETYGRIPSLVLQGKSKEQKQNATEQQKKEYQLAAWFGKMKRAKLGKGRQLLYPFVEKILKELFGEKWYEKEDLEGNALEIAIEYKEFCETYGRKPSEVLKSKKQKQNATEQQKKEHQLAKWFGDMKRAKLGKSKNVLYPSVEKILKDLLGEEWYKNNSKNS